MNLRKVGKLGVLTVAVAALATTLINDKKQQEKRIKESE